MASFGDRLRTERERRGVSLREIADATKISLRFLQAIEEDRLDVLPGGLFPRAFVRQYAACLGLDAEPLVAEFAAVQGTAVVPERRPAPPPDRPRVTPVQVGVVVLVLLAAGVVLRRGGSSVPERGAAPPTQDRAASAVLPTDRVYPPAAPAAGEARDGLVMTITADQECWVEVRADGETRVNKVLVQGESLDFEARGELVLSVGNAGGLQLRLNDHRALPLGRPGEVRKNIVITRESLPSMIEVGAARPAGSGSRG